MPISFIKKRVWPIIVAIGTVIGLLVAFFPSLFNLEQKKIIEYSNSINTLSEAQDLINFLKEHQNSIVNI